MACVGVVSCDVVVVGLSGFQAVVDGVSGCHSVVFVVGSVAGVVLGSVWGSVVGGSEVVWATMREESVEQLYEIRQHSVTVQKLTLAVL